MIQTIRQIEYPKAVQKRDGSLDQFDLSSIADAIASAARDLGGTDTDKARELAEKVGHRLADNYGPIINSDTVATETFNVLMEENHESTAWAARIRHRRKQKAIERMSVLGSGSGRKSATDVFLMVGSTSQDTSKGWDRNRIVRSLVRETGVDLPIAQAVAEDVETYVFSSGMGQINTQIIREAAHTELTRRGLVREANAYKNFGVARSELESIIGIGNRELMRRGGTTNNENSNIQGNNPENVNFTLAGKIGKEYALNAVFSPEVGQAHSDGTVHLHDLDCITRLYCSAHSLEYLKKGGLKLDNLQTSSSPAKHTETLTGHLNTFLASMQAYYAGALGIGFFNIFYATHLQADLEQKGRGVIQHKREELYALRKEIEETSGELRTGLEGVLSKREASLSELEQNPMSALTDQEIDAFMMQRGQEAIYAASQNAFSRGGQTLFIDFNLHTGVPAYLKDTLAVLPKGKYGIMRDGKQVLLKEGRLEDKTASGYRLMELSDPETGQVLMRERVVDKDHGQELVQEWRLGPGEKPITYGDYEGTAQRFLHNLIKIYAHGDENGQPFAFPKCDLHIDGKTFSDPAQNKLLEEACEAASNNGSPYFVFDRTEVSLSACCRLRTAIDDNYVIKHPESLRFCGFGNVTINLPHAAYIAARKAVGRNGEDSLDARLGDFFTEVDRAMDIGMQAHLEKKEFIDALQHPGLPQWQTGKPTLVDGMPYVDTNKATYILGLIGLNEVAEIMVGKQLQDLTEDEFEKIALGTVAHMNSRARGYAEKYGLKVALEESPAESAARRLAKADLDKFEEAKKYAKGDLEGDRPFYTNSVHLPADAPVDLITRIKMQGKFHAAIDAGAITHAFIGEEQPDARAIYQLVKKTYEDSQTAQITISPEFTVCKSCHSTTRGMHDKCPNCNNTSHDSLKTMSRIVGYYSFIPGWNASKQAELEKRHEGDYKLAGANGNHPVPTLRNPYPRGTITAMSFGLEGCAMCEDLKSAMDYRQLAQQHGQNFQIQSYEVKTEEGMRKAMLGEINLSQLPALVVLGEDSRVIYKGHTMGSNGSTVPINPSQVRQAIETYLTSARQ